MYNTEQTHIARSLDIKEFHILKLQILHFNDSISHFMIINEVINTTPSASGDKILIKLGTTSDKTTCHTSVDIKTRSSVR